MKERAIQVLLLLFSTYIYSSCDGTFDDGGGAVTLRIITQDQRRFRVKVDRSVESLYEAVSKRLGLDQEEGRHLIDYNGAMINTAAYVTSGAILRVVAAQPPAEGSTQQLSDTPMSKHSPENMNALQNSEQQHISVRFLMKAIEDHQAGRPSQLYKAILLQ